MKQKLNKGEKRIIFYKRKYRAYGNYYIKNGKSIRLKFCMRQQ